MTDATGRAVAALELNDTGLVLAGSHALEAVEPSPGIALVDDGRIVTGRAAEERARLKPRWVHQSYWSELSLEPLQQPFPTGLRSADLAFAQLDELWSEALTRLDGVPAPERVLLVAPGSFSLPRLGVALAVARRAGIPMSGCVDAAVAAASTLTSPPSGESWVHLDLERGRAVATELRYEADRGEVVRRRVVPEERVGLARLVDDWARAVAREFVRTTRFDPLTLAATEQELYLRLPGWLARLADEEEINVAIAVGGRVHEVELTRPWMAAAAALSYERLAELARATAAAAAPPIAFLLSHRMSWLPGFELPGHPPPPAVALAPRAALAGALAGAKRIDHPGEEALPLVVRLALGG